MAGEVSVEEECCADGRCGKVRSNELFAGDDVVTGVSGRRGKCWRTCTLRLVFSVNDLSQRLHGKRFSLEEVLALSIGAADEDRTALGSTTPCFLRMWSLQ